VCEDVEAALAVCGEAPDPAGTADAPIPPD
jgi:hypothetical protein